MEYIRVYHPETNEPFDVPEYTATRLRLEEGWLSHPIEAGAIPAVQKTPVAEPVESAADTEKAWRKTKTKPVEEPEGSDEA